MSFVNRLEALLEEKGVKWAEVSKELCIGINQKKNWETTGKAPNGETLVKLSHYFGVSSDYLLGIDSLKEKSIAILDDPELTLTADEKWFILKLRQLDKEGKAVVEGALVSEARRMETLKGETANAG